MNKNLFTEKYGPYALIAGASEGLGAAFAWELASRGLHLVLVARRKEKLNELADRLSKKYGIKVKALQADLSTESALQKIQSVVSEQEIGMLVYNAAYPLIGLFLDKPVEEHEKVIQVNCRMPMRLVYALGNKMKERGKGGIVLMASMAGLSGSAMIAHYSASKAYNILLAESLWYELRECGIDVIACIAGATSTPNYIQSQPQPVSVPTPPILKPESVVKEALNALGKKPSLITGFWNRLSSFLMHRIFSRKKATKVMASNTYKIYSNYR